MFSRISSRRRTGLLEGNDSVLLNAASQAIFTNRFGDDIHRAIKNALQPTTKGLKPPKICKSAAGSLVRKPHDNIDVGIIALFTPSGRSEQCQARHSGGPKLLFVRPQPRDDFFATHAPILRFCPRAIHEIRTQRRVPIGNGADLLILQQDFRLLLHVGLEISGETGADLDPR
jgi:hypothetical protein